MSRRNATEPCGTPQTPAAVPNRGPRPFLFSGLPAARRRSSRCTWIECPDSVRRWLADPASETPKPGHGAFAHVENRIIAAAKNALAAAERSAVAAGCRTMILGDALEGESRAVARDHARLARAWVGDSHAAGLPGLLISGGETTVAVKGPGRGGRNAEFLLALADRKSVV